MSYVRSLLKVKLQLGYVLLMLLKVQAKYFKNWIILILNVTARKHFRIKDAENPVKVCHHRSTICSPFKGHVFKLLTFQYCWKRNVLKHFIFQVHNKCNKCWECSRSDKFFFKKNSFLVFSLQRALIINTVEWNCLLLVV